MTSRPMSKPVPCGLSWTALRCSSLAASAPQPGRPPPEKETPSAGDAVAQQVLLHLAGGGLRQLAVDESLRHLECRQSRADEGGELRVVDVGVRAESHVGDGDLTPLLVRRTYHRRLQHSGMGVEGSLHLDRGDVLAAGDDDVLAAVADLEVAVRMDDG